MEIQTSHFTKYERVSTLVCGSDNMPGRIIGFVIWSAIGCIFGIVLIVLGIPLLAGRNSPWILLSVAGLVMESIIAMVIYTLVIEKKYKKSK